MRVSYHSRGFAKQESRGGNENVNRLHSHLKPLAKRFGQEVIVSVTGFIARLSSVSHLVLARRCGLPN